MPLVIIALCVVIVFAGFAAFFYAGRALLNLWERKAAQRDAHVSARRMNMYSMSAFKGTKSSEWHK